MSYVNVGLVRVPVKTAVSLVPEILPVEQITPIFVDEITSIPVLTRQPIQEPIIQQPILMDEPVFIPPVAVRPWFHSLQSRRT